MNPFSSEEERRVSDAITQAERKTSGEIVVVVAARSDTYLYIPPLIAALLSLLLPWPLIFFTKLDVEAIYLAQLALFLVLTALLLPPAVRTALVPQHIKRLHAHRRAVEQFQRLPGAVRTRPGIGRASRPTAPPGEEPPPDDGRAES